MQVIIAEKPSVAREIAAIVGAKNRKEGYIEGNGYIVTWAFGHLIQLAMPQQYGVEGFKAEHLPILPPKFILLPRQIRESKEYTSDPGVLKQLSVIKGAVQHGRPHRRRYGRRTRGRVDLPLHLFVLGVPQAVRTAVDQQPNGKSHP